MPHGVGLPEMLGPGSLGSQATISLGRGEGMAACSYSERRGDADTRGAWRWRIGTKQPVLERFPLEPLQGGEGVRQGTRAVLLGREADTKNCFKQIWAAPAHLFEAQLKPNKQINERDVVLQPEADEGNDRPTDILRKKCLNLK